MESKDFSMDLAGRTFKFSVSPMHTMATGFVIASLGDTVIMANALVSGKGKEGADFFPLTVEYEENMYAAGKIKGSRFIKREGRPSDNAILTSRLIDRPIRPLFPKGTTNEVQLICSALSADLEVDPGTTALNAASAALMITGAPFAGPVGAVRMGYVEKDGKWTVVVNPTYEECEKGKLNLVVAGTLNAITMVEAAASEVTEDVILEALDLAHKHIKQICELQVKFAEAYKKEHNVQTIELAFNLPTEEEEKAVAEVLTDEMLETIKGVKKLEVKDALHAVQHTVLEKLGDKVIDNFHDAKKEGKFYEGRIKEIIESHFEKLMRKKILEKNERLDGRKPEEIRPLSAQVGILPRTHGTGLFNRGETQALTIVTLGSPSDAQTIDTMDTDKEKRYMHHYHFPAYATGEIKPVRGPSRREIGHGDLAERALLPVLPPKEQFPYTMWLVSEIMSCNGSSSMASVCGSTLALMDAGVPIIRPVSGVAMGLVMGDDNQSYKILTDIQGAEDFAGDMDFKVTGTAEGITALQMDIKVTGISVDLMKNALQRAKEARLAILEAMLKAIPEPRKQLSQYAPLIMNIMINPELIRIVIGKGGETIQAITKECKVEMDIDDDGTVTITAPDQPSGQKAIDWINRLTYQPKVGDVFEGKVVRLMEFGAFVEISPGKDGLVHISQLAKDRVNKVTDVVKLGDTLKVKLMEIDDQGRYNLSHKATL